MLLQSSVIRKIMTKAEAGLTQFREGCGEERNQRHRRPIIHENSAA